jgi:hypothetical protein
MRAAADEEAALEAARLEQVVMGVAIDIHPMDALLMTVRISAGEVAYATRKIAELTQEEEVVRPEIETTREGGSDFDGATHELQKQAEELNLWVRVRQQGMDRLAKFSKMALDAGAEERRVRVAEQAGEGLALAIRAILEGLQLNPDQERRAPELVREALELLERGGEIEGRLLPM